MSFYMTRPELHTQEVNEYMSPDNQLDTIHAHFIPDNLFLSNWEGEDDEYGYEYITPNPFGYVYSQPPAQLPPPPQNVVYGYEGVPADEGNFYGSEEISKSTRLSDVTSLRSRSPVDFDEKQISVSNDSVDFRPKTLNDVRRIREIAPWALKKHTSLKLQEFVRNASDDEKQEAWRQIVNDAVKLSKDPYGNMFMQEFLAQASPNLRMEMASHLVSHVKEMAHDQFGCWVIQKAFELMPHIGDYWFGYREFGNGLSSCLTDEDLSQLIVCKNGHYVIQKLLETNISALVLERIERVLYGNIRELSVNSSAYHVVLQTLECATPQFKEYVLEEVSEHCLHLSRDQFGNYVVKRVIELNDNISHTIGYVVKENLAKLSLNKFATHVVETYLNECSKSELSKFVDKLLKRSDKKFAQFLKHQTGNYVAQCLIRLAARKDVMKLKKRLDLHNGKLKKIVQNSHGCHVIEELEKKIRN